MSFLLDTQVALWVVTNNPRLPAATWDHLKDPQVVVWVSAAQPRMAMQHQTISQVLPMMDWPGRRTAEHNKGFFAGYFTGRIPV